MTVKELKEILDGCDDNAIVITHLENSDQMLRDHQVYHNGIGTVIIDVDGTFDGGKTEQSKKFAAEHGIPVVEVKLSGAYPSYPNFINMWKMKKDGE